MALHEGELTAEDFDFVGDYIAEGNLSAEDLDFVGDYINEGNFDDVHDRYDAYHGEPPISDTQQHILDTYGDEYIDDDNQEKRLTTVNTVEANVDVQKDENVGLQLKKLTGHINDASPNTIQQSISTVKKKGFYGLASQVVTLNRIKQPDSLSASPRYVKVSGRSSVNSHINQIYQAIPKFSTLTHNCYRCALSAETHWLYFSRVEQQWYIGELRGNTKQQLYAVLKSNTNFSKARITEPQNWSVYDSATSKFVDDPNVFVSIYDPLKMLAKIRKKQIRKRDSTHHPPGVPYNEENTLKRRAQKIIRAYAYCCVFVLNILIMLIFGAVFSYLEYSNEVMQEREAANVAAAWNSSLTKCVSVFNESGWENYTSVDFYEACGQIGDSFEKFQTYSDFSIGPTTFSDNDEYDWTFAGSLLYCFTVMTTIGYGSLSPVTTSGKSVTILYMLIAIPWCLALLSLTSVKLQHFIKDATNYFRTDDGKKLVKCIQCNGEKGCEHCTDGVIEVQQDNTSSVVVVSGVTFISFFVIMGTIFTSFGRLDDGVTGHPNWTFGDGIYFAMVSFTTVGFGDYNVHITAKDSSVFATVVLTFVGVSVFATFFGAMGNSLMKLAGPESKGYTNLSDEEKAVIEDMRSRELRQVEEAKNPTPVPRNDLDSGNKVPSVIARLTEI
eukprot:m.152379 g.152379  ORF g.152379 m.152379 type:complete len:668 (+) comp30805_c0_seq1:83-2086(+)